MIATDRQPRVLWRKELAGRLIGAIRIRQGLRQVDIAASVDLTQATLDRLESGRSALTFETLLDLAECLGTTGPSIACLLDALVHDLAAEGYEVLRSPPRGGRAGVTLPESDLDGRVLAAYVGGWLERNRDLPELNVPRAVDAWQAPAPLPTPDYSAYAPARAMVTQQ